MGFVKAEEMGFYSADNAVGRMVESLDVDSATSMA
jgi:hypothetical protein